MAGHRIKIWGDIWKGIGRGQSNDGDDGGSDGGDDGGVDDNDGDGAANDDDVNHCHNLHWHHLVHRSRLFEFQLPKSRTRER